jgi:hypothetical protein
MTRGGTIRAGRQETTIEGMNLEGLGSILTLKLVLLAAMKPGHDKLSSLSMVKHHPNSASCHSACPLN